MGNNMRAFIMILAIAAVTVCLPSLSYGEQNSNGPNEKIEGIPATAEKAGKERTQTKNAFTSRLFAYKPPKRGAPGGRMGGGTRGKEEEAPFFSVLAPDHAGLTIRNQPTLYWFLATPTSRRIEFSLNIEKEGKTVLHKKIDVSGASGIKKIHLSQLGIKLRPDMQYTWFITLVLDPDNPSKDMFSSGTIEQIVCPENLREKLDRAEKNEIAAIYAENGIWYDALNALSDQIEQYPGNRQLREQRAALLGQVGLQKAAEAEKGN